MIVDNKDSTEKHSALVSTAELADDDTEEKKELNVKKEI